MDNCPPEIWTNIFSFACTDGGQTGRSLSLVSRDFNTTSRPLKHQSLAVNGRRQLAHLRAKLLDPQRHPSDLLIRYLFISVKVDEEDEENEEADDEDDLPLGGAKTSVYITKVLSRATSLGTAEVGRLMSRLDKRGSPINEHAAPLGVTIYADIASILYTIRPHVRSLTLYTDIPSEAAMFVPGFDYENDKLQPLEQLEDLAIRHREVGCPNDTWKKYDGPVLFPNLRHMHLEAPQTHTPNFFNYIGGTAPNLEFLHISIETLLLKSNTLLYGLGHSPPGPKPLEALPESLKQVTIDPCGLESERDDLQYTCIIPDGREKIDRMVEWMDFRESVFDDISRIWERRMQGLFGV